MKNFKPEANEMLQRNEMKTVIGGYVSIMTCANGAEFTTGSCSDWAINHYCEANGGLDICVG